MEIQVYRGYWMLNWFAKEFGEKESLEAAIQHRLTLELLNEEMLKIPPGSEGLVLQPYWGPGLSRPLSKGAIIGFSDTHTRIHLYRAIIEGIAYALRDGLEEFESRRLHHKIKEIRISGGGSQSDAICQITSDIFGLPVSRVQTYETSSLGAAIVGFIGINEYQNIDDATKEMVKISKTFYPNMDNHQKYDYLFYKAYRKMYPKRSASALQRRLGMLRCALGTRRQYAQKRIRFGEDAKTFAHRRPHVAGDDARSDACQCTSRLATDAHLPATHRCKQQPNDAQYDPPRLHHRGDNCLRHDYRREVAHRRYA